MWTRCLTLILLLILVSACGDETEKRIVDFSKTIIIDRPETKVIDDAALKVAVGAMVSPKETLIYYQQILDVISAGLGKRIELVQRKTYKEINELLTKGEIDLAFLCSGPYAALKKDQGFELIATPEIGGRHFYQAYLIVNKNSTFDKLEDLKGHTFAFTDPDSNTGRLVPIYWLAKMGERPETFFKHVIYTYSHDNSIAAVAKGLVDGASVDGLVWDYFQKQNPNLTSQTRIIMKSDNYGIPPLVASKKLPESIKKTVKDLLFSLHHKEEGKKILSQLMIDRFIVPEDQWYDSIRHMQQSINSAQTEDHVSQKYEN